MKRQWCGGCRSEHIVWVEYFYKNVVRKTCVQNLVPANAVCPNCYSNKDANDGLVDEDANNGCR